MRSINGANLGFEKKLWKVADKLRSNMDAAEYKHVVLGLIFLKYISDAFEEHKKELDKEVSDPKSEWYVKEPSERYYIKEEKEAYTKDNIFWVPEKSRWGLIEENAKRPEIGKIIDEAMDVIEKENPSLKGVLPKDYSRPTLDKQRLGELIDLIGTIGLGDKENRSKDVLGRVYEYFLGQFADAEGKKGGQFYTPRCIVDLLVKMIEPYQGRVFDPCCGSGGMFVQSEKFVKKHGGRKGDIYVYGQESNPTTWKLCKMNLAIRGIDNDVQLGDSFHDDQHKDLRSDFVLANPPFNMSDWGGELLREDVRWEYGVPPTGNANFAWVQHFIHHLSPTGMAGFVLANGSMTSNLSNEGKIRREIIRKDMVDCIVALPDKLFYNTPIHSCLWFVTRDKKDNKFRDRRGQILFIDTRNMGEMIGRKHKELNDKDIKKISETYHAWRGEKELKYKNIPGFCKSVSIEEIKNQGYRLLPGRYIFSREGNNNEKIKDYIRNFINDKISIQNKLEDINKELNKRLSFLNDKFSNIDFSKVSVYYLENLAKKIFEGWFINYNFPNKEGKPYKNSGGKMKDSEFGLIPSDWEIKRISDELKVELGGTPSRTKKEYWNGNINWINSGKINEFRILTPSEKITKKGLKNSATKLLPSKTVVIAITGSTLGKISLLEIDSCTNQSVVGILENNEIPFEYIYFWIKSIKEDLMSWQTGGAQQHINKGNIEESPLLVPDKITIKKYKNLVEKIFELISIKSFSNTQNEIHNNRKRS